MRRQNHLHPAIPLSPVAVGPMSKSTVDACAEIAYERGYRFMLIASRRQVEHSGLAPGYVEGWTTQDFASYVRGRDPHRRLLLCRDHGGPWQHPSEHGVADEVTVMNSSAASFLADIDAGFDLLHIDTSAELDGEAQREVAVNRMVELYGQCHEYARDGGQSIEFEIGFEDQAVETNDPEDFAHGVRLALGGLHEAGLPGPRFIVAQTGTKVVELRNVGALTRPSERSRVGSDVEALAEVCHANGAELKAHNCDYLDDASWRELVQRGVAAFNIAPEFGVVETKALLALLDRCGLKSLVDEFLAMAYDSGNWRKWLEPHSSATEFERAVMAGHYVFAADRAREIRAEAALGARRRGLDAETVLRNAVKGSIERYLDVIVTEQLAARYATALARS